MNERPLHVYLLYTLICLLAGACGSQQYDLVITGGTVYDGSGNTPVTADIAIRNGLIGEISPSIDPGKSRVIDASGLAIAPGFIDVHAHIAPITIYPEAESFIRQGVTTTLGGPDGSSPLPLGEYLDSLQQQGIGVNVAYLVGQGSVRADVMALEDRVPTPAELDSMRARVRAAMQAGAFGISTGLKYLPGTFSSTEEVIAVSKVAAEMGGIYTSHLRDEGLGLIASVQEAIRIAAQADIRVVLTHHKAIGQPMWG
ncbi:MAG: amidohydrolase family protein, partial [Saprospiraceae bacterium]|nr:amidohydrolase family protein [Saprospiraceae bacterium]